MSVKSAEEIRRMRDSCRIASEVLDELCAMIAPGMNTWDIDQAGKQLIERKGAKSACYQYKVGKHRYPGFVCLSVNEVVVHGIGTLRCVLKPGDIISIDVSVEYNGFIGDNARTVAVGKVDPSVARLMRITEESLYLGIEQARVGNRTGDIGYAIQNYVERAGYSVIRDFQGHGVGRTMHEEPSIPCFGRRGTGAKLKEGMTIAIEPMVAMGTHQLFQADDGWTVWTRDRRPAAHFEHTVLITQGSPEVLTTTKKTSDTNRFSVSGPATDVATAD